LGVKLLLRFQEGEAVMQCDAQAIDISTSISLKKAHFGSSVAQCTKSPRITRFSCFKQACDAKVDQIDPSFRGYHNVGGFEVAEDDRGMLPIMKIDQYITQLHSVVQDKIDGQWMPPHTLYVFEQRLTLYELHHKVVAASFLKPIIDTREMSMAQRAKNLHLLIEEVFCISERYAIHLVRL
jgi:hypothetical protein